MKKNILGRQGDVTFVTRQIPKGAKRIPLRPFAVGESTGHSHRVMEGYEDAVEMYEKDGEIFVRIVGEVDVPTIHEDHDPAGEISILPKGWEGEVLIRTEYDEEEGFRKVVD